MTLHPWTPSGLELLRKIKHTIIRYGGNETTAALIKAENRLLFQNERDDAFRVLYPRHQMRTLSEIFNMPLRQVYMYANLLGLKRGRSVIRFTDRRCYGCMDKDTGIFYHSLCEAARVHGINPNSVYSSRWFNERFFRLI